MVEEDREEEQQIQAVEGNKRQEWSNSLVSFKEKEISTVILG